MPGIGTIQGLLRQQPGQRDLRGRRSLAVRDRAEQVDQRLVRLPGLGREARDTVLRKSELSNVVVSSILPVRKPLPKRAERHEADAEFLESRQDLRLRLAPPQRVLALERGDRLDRVRPADRLHAGLGQAEVP